MKSSYNLAWACKVKTAEQEFQALKILLVSVASGNHKKIMINTQLSSKTSLESFNPGLVIYVSQVFQDAYLLV